CLNEGNAQLLAGVVPQAILAYQRGLRLAPNDARLRENLAYARQRVAYPGERGRPPPSAWPPWLPRPSIELLVALAAVVYLLACVVFTRWLMVRQVGGRFRACLLLGIAIAISGVAYLKLAGNDDEDRHPLVVIAVETGFQRGNGESYARHPDLPLLLPGLEGRGLHQRGDWLQVQLASGAIGWVRREHVLVDQ